MVELSPLRCPAPDLTDGVVVLRRWSFNDLACIEEASHDPAIVESTTVPRHYSPAGGRAFVERQWARQSDHEGVSLAIADADTNTARGLVSLMLRPIRGTVGLGYWITPSARGRHLAKRATALAAGWAIRCDGIERVEAWIEPSNAASREVVRAAGLVEEGVLRAYLSFETRRADAVVYSLVSSDVVPAA